MSSTMNSTQHYTNETNPDHQDWELSSEDFEHLAKEEKLEHLSQIYSPTSSGYCYNGITKHPYPFKKNHSDARKLFAVHECQGSHGRKDPYKIYYDTPEQYQRHRNVRLNPNIINAFYKRQSQLAD